MTAEPDVEPDAALGALRVRGGATPEEVAAVLAALSRVGRRGSAAVDADDAYERWRSGRLRALRETAGR
jgi:hypothetical protein